MSFVAGFLFSNGIHGRLLTHPADEKKRWEVLRREGKIKAEIWHHGQLNFPGLLGLESNS